MTDDDRTKVPTARGRSHDDDHDQGDDDDDPERPQLLVGEPFAIAHDCEIRSDYECSIVVQCDCGKPFKLLLLEAGNKPCPHCGKEYTHMLLICATDNDDAFCSVLEILADVNPLPGQPNPNAGDDDQGDDDGGDDQDDD